MLNLPTEPPIEVKSVLEDGKNLARKLENINNSAQQCHTIKIVRPKGLEPSKLQVLRKQSNLKELELEYVPIDSSNIDDLITAINASPLKRFSICHNAMPKDCVGKIYQAILEHKTLSDLRINGMWLDGGQINEVLAFFEKPNLRKIDLRFNQFSIDNIEAIYNAARASYTIEGLKLSRSDNTLSQHLLNNAINTIQYDLIGSIISDMQQCNSHAELNLLKVQGEKCFNKIKDSGGYDKTRHDLVYAEFNHTLGLAQASMGRYEESEQSLSSSLTGLPAFSAKRTRTKKLIDSMKRARNGELSDHKVEKLVKMNSPKKQTNLPKDFPAKLERSMTRSFQKWD